MPGECPATSDVPKSEPSHTTLTPLSPSGSCSISTTTGECSNTKETSSESGSTSVHPECTPSHSGDCDLTTTYVPTETVTVCTESSKTTSTTMQETSCETESNSPSPTTSENLNTPPAPLRPESTSASQTSESQICTSGCYSTDIDSTITTRITSTATISKSASQYVPVPSAYTPPAVNKAFKTSSSGFTVMLSFALLSILF